MGSLCWKCGVDVSGMNTTPAGFVGRYFLPKGGRGEVFEEF